MADVAKAADFVLRQEDSTLSGVITDATGDLGMKTRFGISQRWHPELTPTGFFDDMPTAEALALAEKTFATEYAPPLYLGAISSQALATALLSFAGLEGITESVLMLQHALQALGWNLSIDGEMGPQTLAATNAADPAKALSALVGFQKWHFAQIAQADPSQNKWLVGWDNRADAFSALLTA